MALTAGTRLGPYEIEKMIGAGGMGEVYRARDHRLERMVAVKVLDDASGDPEFRERFRREARALSRLSHPNVCAVYDVGTEDARNYFVMELLEGETLATRLDRGPLPVERICQRFGGLSCMFYTSFSYAQDSKLSMFHAMIANALH